MQCCSITQNAQGKNYMHITDSIVAQATPPGRGGIGIVRISGNKAKEVALAVLGKIPTPRYADYLSFRDINGLTLDHGIALWFPAPSSFTGEDVLELQGHGGSVVLDLLIKSILTLPGLRIANPGEFSERAFLNNKLDLVQAEAIADLIDASSEQAARSAINSLQGEFSIRINQLLETLTSLRSYVEATLDFPDEEIHHSSNNNQINMQLNHVMACLDCLCIEAYRGSLFREGIKVVIAGLPNAGKSSLLNALAKREVAIVTNIAGTTRDIIKEHIHIDGIPLHVVDTAGLREATNDVEKIGIERAWHEIKHADRVLFIVDSSTVTDISLEEIWKELVDNLPKCLPVTVVRNKVDISGEKIGITEVNGLSIVRISVLTGHGIDLLCDHLKTNMCCISNTEGNFLARRRHLQALEAASKHLANGKENVENNYAMDLLAEELRLAQLSLSEITGKFPSDRLLEQIFSSFCIGK